MSRGRGRAAPHPGCGAEGSGSTTGRSPSPRSGAAGPLPEPRGRSQGAGGRLSLHPFPSSASGRPRPPAAQGPAPRPPARRYLGVGAELGRAAGAERLGRGLQVDGAALRGLHARGAAAQPAVEVRRHHRDGSLGRQDGDGQALPGAAAGAPPAAAAAGCLEERRDAAGFGAAAGAAAHQHGRGAAPHRQLLPGERRGERSGIVTRRAAAGPRPPAPIPRPPALPCCRRGFGCLAPFWCFFFFLNTVFFLERTAGRAGERLGFPYALGNSWLHSEGGAGVQGLFWCLRYLFMPGTNDPGIGLDNTAALINNRGLKECYFQLSFPSV